MEKKVNLILNVFYYGFYALAILAALVMWYLVTQRQMPTIDVYSTAGKVIQYVVILYVIISVSGALFMFKKVMDKVKLSEDHELKLRKYRSWGIVRIVLIGTGIVLGIVAFYWLGGYRSMIWCAAISTIGLYFCKPTLRKMELELQQTPTENN